MPFKCHNIRNLPPSTPEQKLCSALLFLIDKDSEETQKRDILVQSCKTQPLLNTADTNTVSAPYLVPELRSFTLHHVTKSKATAKLQTILHARPSKAPTHYLLAQPASALTKRTRRGPRGGMPKPKPPSFVIHRLFGCGLSSMRGRLLKGQALPGACWSPCAAHPLFPVLYS